MPNQKEVSQSFTAKNRTRKSMQKFDHDCVRIVQIRFFILQQKCCGLIFPKSSIIFFHQFGLVNSNRSSIARTQQLADTETLNLKITFKVLLYNLYQVHTVPWRAGQCFLRIQSCEQSRRTQLQIFTKSSWADEKSDV